MSRAKSWVPALLALLLGGAICLTPSTAYAQSVDRRDPRGDVSRVDQGTMKGTSAPGRTNGDVVRTVLRHKKHRVRIRVGFADLRRSFGALDITAFIDTSKGLHREAVISVDRNDLNDPWRGVSWLDNGEDQVRCAVHHSLDYQHNVAIIGFSRSCLNRPRWVRIGVNVRTWPPYPEDERPVLRLRGQWDAAKRWGRPLSAAALQAALPRLSCVGTCARTSAMTGQVELADRAAE